MPLINDDNSLSSKNKKKDPLPNKSKTQILSLKKISKRVMEIIKEEGPTTYKYISKKIVEELDHLNKKDEKNLKRRIYDSLNVMKSLKVIERDKKKDIVWNYDAENDPLKQILKEEDEKDSEYISTEEY